MTNTPRKTDMSEFFNQEMATHYDERNANLSDIGDNLHFLVRLVLGDLPPHARILCVGVGTGAEILSLAKANTQWSFVGLDPSAPMLDVCRERLQQANLGDRCQLVHGDISCLSKDPEFDAVLSILVAHFIERHDRIDFYQGIHNRLKSEGYFVSAEISYDLNSSTFPTMLKNWERVQTLMGATPDSLKTLQDTLRNTLSVLSPDETETLLRNTGFDHPIQFFQAFMIRAWYAKK